MKRAKARCSGTTRDLAEGAAGLAFDPRGRYHLKGRSGSTSCSRHHPRAKRPMFACAGEGSACRHWRAKARNLCRRHQSLGTGFGDRLEASPGVLGPLKEEVDGLRIHARAPIGRGAARRGTRCLQRTAQRMLVLRVRAEGGYRPPTASLVRTDVRERRASKGLRYVPRPASLACSAARSFLCSSQDVSRRPRTTHNPKLRYEAWRARVPRSDGRARRSRRAARLPR
jgi:hypothetical protein